MNRGIADEHGKSLAKSTLYELPLAVKRSTHTHIFCFGYFGGRNMREEQSAHSM